MSIRRRKRNQDILSVSVAHLNSFTQKIPKVLDEALTSSACSERPYPSSCSSSHPCRMLRRMLRKADIDRYSNSLLLFNRRPAGWLVGCSLCLSVFASVGRSICRPTERLGLFAYSIGCGNVPTVVYADMCVCVCSQYNRPPQASVFVEWCKLLKVKTTQGFQSETNTVDGTGQIGDVRRRRRRRCNENDRLEMSNHFGRSSGNGRRKKKEKKS